MAKEIEIGFDRYFKRPWMDYCFNLMAAGTDRKQVRELFLDFLMEELPGKDGRRKTFTVINRIWVSPSEELTALRDDALKLKPAAIVHWVMCMAAYPFFASVAEVTGRLSSLDDKISKQQIVRRLYEKYGDREIIERAGRHVLRTFVELGVLVSKGRGLYQKAQKVQIINKEILPLIVEATIRTNDKKIMPVKEIVQNFALFPFQLDQLSYEIIDNDRIEYARHGLDKEIYVLKHDYR
jgi:hypothetical protein